MADFDKTGQLLDELFSQAARLAAAAALWASENAGNKQANNVFEIASRIFDDLNDDYSALVGTAKELRSIAMAQPKMVLTITTAANGVLGTLKELGIKA